MSRRGFMRGSASVNQAQVDTRSTLHIGTAARRSLKQPTMSVCRVRVACVIPRKILKASPLVLGS